MLFCLIQGGHRIIDAVDFRDASQIGEEYFLLVDIMGPDSFY